jgi:glycosyltransferase involved in cell wall biosynthesis
MKILLHAWEYPPRGSGIGHYIGHMSAALRAAGHFTVIVTSRGDGLPAEENLENGVVYRAYDVSEIGTARISGLVLNFARRHAVDWIEGVDHLGESAGLLALRDRPPMMINCRYNDVASALRYAQAFYPWQKLMIALACFRDRARLARERFSIEHADILAAPASRMFVELEREGLSLPARRRVLPKPINLLTAWENSEAPDPVLLQVGRVDIGKGIQYLPDLLREVVREYPGARLEMAGSDSYARGIGSVKDWLIRRFGDLAGHVRFLGQIGPLELDEAYRRAWVVVVPSRWDTSPTCLFEAMIRRKAIVASPHGGMPEILEETGCPVLDPSTPAFREAVLGSIGDRNAREQAGQAGEIRVARCYSPGPVAREYLAFLESCA